MPIPGVGVTEATGVPPLPSTAILSRCAILAVSDSGSLETQAMQLASDVADEYDQGPLVRSGRHILARTRTPILTQRCEATNVGSYATLDDSGFTGTAEAAVVSSEVPTDEAELYVKFVEGGDVLTSGITYRRSDSYGREGDDSMPLRKLGTGSRIEFPDVNGAIELNPPEAELVAYVADLRTQTIAHFANIGNLDEVIALANDLKAKYNAHRVLTAGSVHGGVDSTNVTSSPNATDLASAITLLNELRTDYNAHIILTSGSVHGGADLTNNVTAAVATNLATAVTLANELRTKYEAHRVLTSGSVHGLADSVNTILVNAVTATHGAADGTSGASIPSAPTTLALARTCMIALKAAALAHVVLTSGSVHGAADSDAQTALTAISISSSSTGQQVRTAALAYADAMFGDGATTDDAHTLRTASSIHGIEDTTSLLTASEPTTGTVVAGDILRVNTVAPSPTSDELAAAFAALVESDYTPALILIPGRTPRTYGTTISTGLDNMAAAGKPCLCIVQPRKQSDADGSLSNYRENVETEWADNVSDNRILVAFGDYLCTFTDGSKDRQRLIGYAPQLMTRFVRTEYFRTIWAVALGQLEDVTIKDAAGSIIGWDEPSGRDTKLQVLYRVPDAERGRPLVPSIDYTLADLDVDRTTTGRERRVTDELHRLVRSWGLGQVGALSAVTRINSTSGTLKESVRQSYQRSLAAIIQQRMGGTAPDCAITDTDKPDLVAINPTVTLSGAIVYLAVTVNYTIVGANGRVDAELSVRTGEG